VCTTTTSSTESISEIAISATNNQQPTTNNQQTNNQHKYQLSNINRSTTMATTKIILSKVDPYILDDTVRNLDELLSGNGGGGNSGLLLLPLKSNTGNGNESGSGGGGGSGSDDDDDDDTDRPYLETSFNQIMGEINKYRSPWMKKKQQQQPNNNSNNNVEEEILELEQSANDVWDAYRQLYYGHDNSTGSVYFRRKGSGGGGGGGGDSSSSSGGGGGGSSPVAGGGGLEAFFGIQKKCIYMTDENENENENANANEGDEFARWDSVHYVTIEEPNYDDKTCEYKIISTIWCRFKPEDVGDIPPKIKAKAAAAAALQPKKKAAQAQPPVIIKKPPAAAKPKSPNFKGLDVSRLEIFDKAKDNWNSRHSNSKNDAEVDEEKKKKTTVAVTVTAPPPRQPNNSSPVPAIVTSSAYHEEETIKVCKLLSGSDSNSKNKNKIPIASHIQNIGTEIEKIESNYRKKLEMVHLPKTCEIIQGMYCGNSNGGKSNGGTLSSQSQRRPAGINEHATGMGVGASLIGEIALKAKLKGLGSGGDDSTGGTGNGSKDINKAMESILAAEKKKLVRDNDAAANADTKTNDWKSNLKKNTTSTATSTALPTGTNTATNSNTTNDWKSNLKKNTSTASTALPTGTNTATNATTTTDWKSSLKKTSTTSNTTTTNNNNNENATNTSVNLQAGLKKTSTIKPTATMATKTATPEFLDFRSKLKSASSTTAATTTPSSPIK
jgi:hypothetical protein